MPRSVAQAPTGALQVIHPFLCATECGPDDRHTQTTPGKHVNLLKQKATPDDDSDIHKQFLSEHFAANRTTL